MHQFPGKQIWVFLAKPDSINTQVMKLAKVFQARENGWQFFKVCIKLCRVHNCLFVAMCLDVAIIGAGAFVSIENTWHKRQNNETCAKVKWKLFYFSLCWGIHFLLVRWDIQFISQQAGELKYIWRCQLHSKKEMCKCYWYRSENKMIYRGGGSWFFFVTDKTGIWLKARQLTWNQIFKNCAGLMLVSQVKRKTVHRLLKTSDSVSKNPSSNTDDQRKTTFQVLTVPCFYHSEVFHCAKDNASVERNFRNFAHFQRKMWEENPWIYVGRGKDIICDVLDVQGLKQSVFIFDNFTAKTKQVLCQFLDVFAHQNNSARSSRTVLDWCLLGNAVVVAFWKIPLQQKQCWEVFHNVCILLNSTSSRTVIQLWFSWSTWKRFVNCSVEKLIMAAFPSPSTASMSTHKTVPGRQEMSWILMKHLLQELWFSWSTWKRFVDCLVEKLIIATFSKAINCINVNT